MSTEDIIEYLKTKRHTAFILWTVEDVIEYSKSSPSRFCMHKKDAKDIVKKINENIHTVDSNSKFNVLIESLVYKKIDELNSIISKFMGITFDPSTNQHYDSKGEMIRGVKYNGQWGNLLKVAKKIRSKAGEHETSQITEGIMSGDEDFTFNAIIRFIRKYSSV